MNYFEKALVWYGKRKYGEFRINPEIYFEAKKSIEYKRLVKRHNLKNVTKLADMFDGAFTFLVPNKEVYKINLDEYISVYIDGIEYNFENIPSIKNVQNYKAMFNLLREKHIVKMAYQDDKNIRREEMLKSRKKSI